MSPLFKRTHWPMHCRTNGVTVVIHTDLATVGEFGAIDNPAQEGLVPLTEADRARRCWLNGKTTPDRRWWLMTEDRLHLSGL